MIKLTIDNRPVEVEQGASILDAANKLGVKIPTMCHLKGYSNHPSCMVCVVKDNESGLLQPSCAFPAKEGMDVSTTDAEVIEARKDALELLLSDHVGDCEAPCRVACPAFMDIPQMNRLIAIGEFDKALQVVKQEIALPISLGYICSAPCENACRRKGIDGAVSICQLKKFVSLEDALSDNIYHPEKAESTGKKVAILGAGVAGLSAAYTLIRLGHDVTVFERESKAGGTLKNVADQLPTEVLEKEIAIIGDFGVEVIYDKNIEVAEQKELQKKFDAILLATGQDSANNIGIELNAKGTGVAINKDTFETSVKGIFACGSVVRMQKMAVQALAQGKHAAFSIHKNLTGDNVENKKSYFNSKFGKLSEAEFEVYTSEGKNNAAILLANRTDNFTKDQAVLEAERCMHCDCRKATNCKLRDYANEYKVNQKNYQTGERKLLQKQITHDLIIYEEEKCIRCGLCVDITESENEELGLTFIGRGFDVRIGVPLNEELGKSLTKVAENVAETCPTGALSFK